MTIPSSFIDQILDQSDIVDIVGRRVQLTKKGSNFWGLCPLCINYNFDRSFAIYDSFIIIMFILNYFFASKIGTRLYLRRLDAVTPSFPASLF